jgi:hypothetical protein
MPFLHGVIDYFGFVPGEDEDSFTQVNSGRSGLNEVRGQL